MLLDEFFVNPESEHDILKEEHLWTSEEKIKYLGYGEWVEEMDSIEFEYSGYIAKIHRIIKKESIYSKENEERYFGGHLCGYIEIPESNVLFGNTDMPLINCHGGITYNASQYWQGNTHESPVSKYHWIGFDCAHGGDIIPSYTKIIGYEVFSSDMYRNMDFCINECKSIIEQLIEFDDEANE